MHDFFEFFWAAYAGVRIVAPIHFGLFIIIVLNGLFIGRLEGWHTSEALYHAFINATTVGYGDFRPKRNLSRFLSVLNAFAGLIFSGILVAVAVNAVQHVLTIAL